MIKVVYLSSTKKGKQLFEWLKQQDCQIVFAETDNNKITSFPDYDLGLGFLYTHKIPLSEFKIPYKWINFHPGPLPFYRGRNLAYHAIMNNEIEFGSTIHYMDERFDTGEIIETTIFPIKSHYTAKDVVEKSYEHLEALFLKHVPMLLKGKVASHHQNEGNYYPKEIINEFVNLSEEQEKKIKALTYHPKFHAKVNISGKTYKIIPD